ncbi:unnamed protein product [Medioppia subpectinata]|uniref:Luciferase n=1 Tax=Medioppia subpectinata TaxID=1979941 RepID=A0A7R9KTV8_9ACAR|nr:unnamed protein product [Medioppia subpectinata]CAG2109652.1 unnamed protein product [Medioppia subpectinata]
MGIIVIVVSAFLAKIDCTLGRKWSKQQVLDSGLNFAHYLLRECAVRKGEVICFASNNSDIHAVGLIGSLAAGLVYCCLAEHSSLDRPTDPSITTPALEDIFTKQRDYSLHLPVRTQLNDTATYGLSSGSTGAPKAIIKTNGNHLATVEALQHREMQWMNHDDIMLSSNFCHASGQRCLFSAINAGAQLAIVRVDENLDDIYGNINKYGITTGFLIPTQLNYLAKNYDKIDRDYLTSLRDVTTGAAPIAEATFRCIQDKYAFKKFRMCYGMTEVGWVSQVPVTGCHACSDYTNVGKLTFNTRLKKTPGYLNNPDENAKVFTTDGFLKSGDIGYYDENGFIYIVGRIKDIINVERTIVTPAEIENVLLTHRDVINAAVFGVRDEDRGEVPMAFVTLAQGSTVSAQEIVDYVDSRVNYYKKLRGGVRILNSMPMTSLKKINRAELKKLIVA